MFKHALTSLAIAASLATLGSGCVIRARGMVTSEPVYVEEEPPPPRVVVVDTRPGFIWVEGRWYRSSNQWVWMDGHWERERVGQAWEQGRWERRGRGSVWVEGHWRSGGGGRPVNNGAPVVRDHREGNQGNGNGNGNNGTVVRDHRTH